MHTAPSPTLSGTDIVIGGGISEHKGPSAYACMKPQVPVHEGGDEAPGWGWEAPPATAHRKEDSHLVACPLLASLRPLSPAWQPWARHTAGAQSTVAACLSLQHSDCPIVRPGARLSRPK